MTVVWVQWISIIGSAGVIVGFIGMAYAVRGLRRDMEQKDYWRQKEIEDAQRTAWEAKRNLVKFTAELGYEFVDVIPHTKVEKIKK